MFTGIIQAKTLLRSRSGPRLVLSDPLPGAGWVIGESVAVNGVCLTLVDCQDGLAFDVSEETDARSTLGKWEPGRQVNLERAMRPVDRFGGHIVQGHVDRVGRLISVDEREGSWTFRFEVGADSDRYLIDKGSVAIDGISLTVVDPIDGQFDVAVIPHTFTETTLGELKPGDAVNIEFDAVAKHIEKLMAPFLRPSTL